MSDYTVKEYPDFVDREKVKADIDEIYGMKFRFRLTIPFVKRNKTAFACVIMKNPSDADSSRCDRTALNVCNNIFNAGYSGVIILNLFPYQTSYAKDVHNVFYKDKQHFYEIMEINRRIVQETCAESDVIFAWGTNTIRNNKEFRQVYNDAIDSIISVIGNNCNVIPNNVTASGYPLHPLHGWDDKFFIKKIIETSLSNEVTEEKTQLDVDNDAYWKSNYLKRMILHSEEKPHPVLHRNMFGASVQVAGVSNQKDQMIYCRRVHKICVPNCTDCKMWVSDEMGYGRSCVWNDYCEGNERIIPHDKAVMEYNRVETDINGPDDLFVD